MLGDLEQFVRRIGAAVDPMRSSRQGDVTVGVDHARDDRRAARVDHAGFLWEIALIGSRSDPDDTVAVDEHAHTSPGGLRWSVRERCVSIENPGMWGYERTGMRRVA